MQTLLADLSANIVSLAPSATIIIDPKDPKMDAPIFEGQAKTLSSRRFDKGKGTCSDSINNPDLAVDKLTKVILRYDIESLKTFLASILNRKAIH